MRKTIISFILSGVLILAFIFIVLPNFIKLVVWFSGDQQPQEETFNYVQPPTLQTPPTATTDKMLTLTGYARSGYTVRVIQNAADVAETTAGDDGAFNVDIELKDGRNALSTYQVASDGSESDVGTVYTVYYDTEEPTIEIIAPENESSDITGKENQQLTVSGSVSEQADLYINDRLTFLDADFNFSYTVQLKEGDNEIVIRAVDEAGNEAEVTRTVSFKE